MRKFFLMIIFVLTLANSSHAKPKLTVRAFDDRTDGAKAPASAIMDMMVTELGKSGIFDLLERERFDLINDEFLLVEKGFIDPSTAPKFGKMTETQYIMTGAITMYYYDETGAKISIPIVGGRTKKKTAYVVLDLRIFDKNSNIIYSGAQMGSASRGESGISAEYGKFFAGIYNKSEGGILAAATRNAIRKHVDEMKNYEWE